MAITEGTCTVDDAGVVTKTDAAEGAYDALVAEFTIAAGDQGIAQKKAIALQARAWAAFLSGYVVTNLKAVIETSDSGLQRDDASSNDTLGPGTKKTLSVE